MVGVLPATRTAERLSELISQSICRVCTIYSLSPSPYHMQQQSEVVAMRKYISGKKCVSLWLVACGGSRQTYHRTVSGHSLSSHYLTLTTVHRYCRSVIPHLFRPSSSLAVSLAHRSSRPATAQVPLLLVVSPASCCFCVCLCLAPCLRTCVDAIQHPALGGCSACSGRCTTRHSHGRAAIRVDLPKHLSCLYYL